MRLTEIARENGVATDYHFSEESMIEQGNFRFREGNGTYLRPEDWVRVDGLIDRLMEKNRGGYKMVSSIKHFEDKKKSLRGNVEPRECRAGRNCLIIRPDGTLAPCFTYYTAPTDWGKTGARVSTSADSRH